MFELILIYMLALVMMVLGVLTMHHLLQGNRAPYGRYNKADTLLKNIKLDSRVEWLLNFNTDARVAWVIQESPSFLIPVYFAFFTEAAEFGSFTNKFLLLLFVGHYFQR